MIKRLFLIALVSAPLALGAVEHEPKAGNAKSDASEPAKSATWPKADYQNKPPLHEPEGRAGRS